MTSARGKVDVTFKKFEDKEKLGAGASRREGGEVKRGKKSTIIKRPSVEYILRVKCWTLSRN